MWLVLTAVLYFLAARLGLAFVLMPEGVAPVWPAGGVFLAALLTTRRERWVWLTGTLFAVDLAAELLAGIPPTLSLIFSVTLAGQAILSAWLIQRFGGVAPTLGTVREVLVLVLLGAAAANLVWALPAAAGSALITHSNFGLAWQWWWVSDATGILVVTPLALTAVPGWRALRAERRSRRLEATLLLAGIVATTSFVFASEPGHRFFSFAYLTLPLLRSAWRRYVRAFEPSTSLATRRTRWCTTAFSRKAWTSWPSRSPRRSWFARYGRCWTGPSVDAIAPGRSA